MTEAELQAIEIALAIDGGLSVSYGCLPAGKVRALIQEVRRLREMLAYVYNAYDSAMHSEFDFPNNPWSPERDGDAKMIEARDAVSVPPPPR